MKKMGRGPRQTILQMRHTDYQKEHEKMLNNANYQRNTNQNKLSHHTDHLSSKKQITAVVKDVEEKEHLYTVGENIHWGSDYEKQY